MCKPGLILSYIFSLCWAIRIPNKTESILAMHNTNKGRQKLRLSASLTSKGTNPLEYPEAHPRTHLHGWQASYFMYLMMYTTTLTKPKTRSTEAAKRQAENFVNIIVL